jgi:hypothetical protein
MLSGLKVLFISVLGIVFLTGCESRIDSFGGDNPATAVTNASIPIINIQPISAAYSQGDTAIPLKIIVSVDDGGVISYQWYKNSVNSNEDGDIIIGETNSNYTPSTLDNGTTYYYVVVTNTNDDVDGENTASVTSNAASVDINIFSVSFYDRNLDLLAKYDNLPLGHEVALDSNKTAYNVGNWYLAGERSPVNSYTLTNKNINFYARDDVVEITDQNELNFTRSYFGGYYILLNDIYLDENGAGFDSDGWRPIKDGGFFNGDFNGNNHKIANLWINRPNKDSVGFFADVTGSIISNLKIEIANGKEIRGRKYVGAIAGTTRSNTIITNTYSSGIISGDEHVGGIAGDLYNSGITNSYSTANVSGDNKVGGIAGNILYAHIINSYSAGIVNGNENIGGILGYSENGNRIINSYSTANVSGNENIGGILGHSNNVEGWEHVESNISNNAAINHLVNGGRANRIIGYIDINSSTISKNFALDSIAGTFSNSDDAEHHGIDKTAEQLKTKETYSDVINDDGLGGLGWNFGDNDTAPWKIDGTKNNGYPYLYWQEL